MFAFIATVVAVAAAAALVISKSIKYSLPKALVHTEHRTPFTYIIYVKKANKIFPKRF